MVASSKQYSVSMLIKADNRVGGPVQSAIGQFNKLGNAASHFSRRAGFHNVRSAVRGLTGDMMHLGGMMRSSMSPFLALGGIASAGGVLALVNSTAAAGDEFAKLSARVGMTSERLQGLQYAADRNGASAQQFRTGMRDLTKNIGEAAAGTGEARGVFKALGVSLTDASGRVKNTEEVFLELSEILPTVEDSSLRLAAAQKIMGESGGVMVNTLMQGRGEIERLIKEKVRLGIITNAQAKAYEGLVDSQTKASSAIKGVGYSIVNHIMPYAGPAIDRFTDWVVTNREFIGQNIGAVIEGIGQRLESVDWQGAVSGVSEFVNWTGSAIQFIGGFDNALLIGAGVLAGPFLAATVSTAFSMGKLAWSVGAATANVAAFIATQSVGAVVSFFQAVRSGVGVVHALNFALAANPVGVVIAGLTALGAVGVGLYNHFEPFRNLINDIWQGIKDLGSAAGDWLSEHLGIDFSAFEDAEKSVKSGVSDVAGGVRAKHAVGQDDDGVAIVYGRGPDNPPPPSIGGYPGPPGGPGASALPSAPSYSDPANYAALAPMGQTPPSAQEITVRLLGFPKDTEVEHKDDGGGLTAFSVVLDTGASTVGGT